MFKRLGVSALLLGSAMALFQPASALADDRYRDHRAREYREHVRRVEVRERRVYVERRPGGYYDARGCWHPYAYYPRY
jgi:hypothetical protein